jgi:argininosuccinate synthase
VKSKKIIIAYSGGLDTSVMLKWLSKKYDAEMIAVTGDLGQKSELDGLEEKALKTGASKLYKLDLKKEFVEEYVWKALKAGALYEGEYPMACAIGRPLLAKKLVEIAELEGADVIAHGATGKGNDQVRFEVGIQSLAPNIKIMAPLRSWEFKSREAEIQFAIENNIPVGITKKSPYSIDENIFGTSIECGILENPELEPPKDVYQITCSPAEAPDYAEKVSIGFESGVPISLNDDLMDGVEIVSKLNEIGGRHGIGRMDLIENRVIGIKSREIYEAPAAAILHKAHNELEKLVMDKESFRFKQDVSNKTANLIYDGLWFSPLFESLMAFVDSTQQYVSGEVKLNLFKGGISVSSRKSFFSLYSEKLATYSSGDSFDHKSAKGFINLYGLPYKTLAEVRKNNNLRNIKNAMGQ